jgi:hypothetical protein
VTSCIISCAGHIIGVSEASWAEKAEGRWVEAKAGVASEMGEMAVVAMAEEERLVVEAAASMAM